MNCDLCELVKNDGFIVTICDHCRIPMIVGREHKPEFSEGEKEQIQELFKGKEIRWEQRKIKSHARCHIL